ASSGTPCSVAPGRAPTEERRHDRAWRVGEGSDSAALSPGLRSPRNAGRAGYPPGRWGGKSARTVRGETRIVPERGAGLKDVIGVSARMARARAPPLQ